jgi:DNA polymerase I-like protein with 3'-5' exonuclease and polymerase domains
MPSYSYVSFFWDPFQSQGARYFLLGPDDKIQELSSSQLSESNSPILCFEHATLILSLRRAGFPAPETLVDIEEALRLAAQVPRNEQGERLWNIKRRIRPHFENSEDADLYWKILRGQSPQPEGSELQDILTKTARALRSLWAETRENLIATGELERFELLEAPLQSVYFYREGAGIAINGERLDTLLREVETEKYAAYTHVARTLNRNPADLTLWNISPLLDQTDASHLSHISDGWKLRDAMKMAAFSSVFSREFLSLVDATTDERILRQISSSVRRTYPTFSVVGTITSRTLVTEPSLQQLRKKYREIVDADIGMKLAYLDFRQFEPGILAFLSQDKALIDAYNAGDVYSSLSQRVFKTTDCRDLSKRMFLAYCYGMSPSGIARLIAGANGPPAHVERMEADVSAFFSAFPDLEVYRAKLAEELVENGRVGSPLGNWRRRSGSGALSSKEKRWALNQPVQATASLIFKESVLDLANTFGRDHLLLPMHDAILMQLPSNKSFATQVELATQLMGAAFEKRCPGLAIRVAVDNFAE